MRRPIAVGLEVGLPQMGWWSSQRRNQSTKRVVFPAPGGPALGLQFGAGSEFGRGLLDMVQVLAD